jgi:hypothetical protein
MGWPFPNSPETQHGIREGQIAAILDFGITNALLESLVTMEMPFRSEGGRSAEMDGKSTIIAAVVAVKIRIKNGRRGGTGVVCTASISTLYLFHRNQSKNSLP